MATYVMQPKNNLGYESAGLAGGVESWKTGVCEIGDCSTCCMAFWCPCIALGIAKNKFDGSDFWVNCCSTNVAMTRFQIRTGYGIEGNAHWDCWTSLCCTCCTINQFAQTVESKGKIPIPNVGPLYNTNERVWCHRRTTCELCYDLWYSFFCCPCALGLIMESSGAPWWFGCCCTNVLQAQNSQRYIRRFEPICCSEMMEDCLCPGICILGFSLVPGVGPYALYLAVPWIWRMLAEENVIKGRSICYGLDIFQTCWNGCQYITNGCFCKTPEGRYLHSEA
jgi:Cys-rich protein (TIGR01571 family)